MVGLLFNRVTMKRANVERANTSENKRETLMSTMAMILTVGKQYVSGEVKMIPAQMCEVYGRRQLCQIYKENSVIRRFYENQ